MDVERGVDRDFIYEHQAFIAVAAACWRKEAPSHSWHVLNWMAYKLRCKYPLVRRQDQIISMDVTC